MADLPMVDPGFADGKTPSISLNRMRLPACSALNDAGASDVVLCPKVPTVHADLCVFTTLGEFE